MKLVNNQYLTNLWYRLSPATLLNWWRTMNLIDWLILWQRFFRIFEFYPEKSLKFWRFDDMKVDKSNSIPLWWCKYSLREWKSFSHYSSPIYTESAWITQFYFDLLLSNSWCCLLTPLYGRNFSYTWEKNKIFQSTKAVFSTNGFL